MSKEIITEIIEDLENTVGLTWPRKGSKINKEKVIECWAEYRKGSDVIFYGYSARKSMSNAYTKLFSNIEGKAAKESWKNYILRKYGYKYCPECENLKDINTFAKDSSVTNKVTTNCKVCRQKVNSIYKIVNSDKINENNAKRRAMKLQRTPKWLNEEDQWMFDEIYSLAKLREKLTGIKWHVDHKIPLQGKLVSGLHIPTNLQVITATENLSKGNTYIGE